MDSLDLDVLRQARDWAREGRPVWLVTVAETWGSAPRPPGSLLCLRDDGLVVGSVSGGCVEDDLIDRVRHGERVHRPTTLVYGVTKDEAARFGLPCGGTLRLVQEPLADAAWIDALLERTARHELVGCW
jgi:xanthine dehydrogenase accessory factor